jgi:putative addiction module component (TIGR02574 family)
MATLTKSEIAALSVDERFALVDNIWESFGETPETLSPPDWHREVLEKRLAAAELAPEASISWEEAREKLAGKWLS